jgi:histone H3/H4
MKKHSFSSYDIEEFLREAGAEKVNEKAVESLRKELEEMIGDLINDANFYAHYAGRKKLITSSDIEIAHRHRGGIGKITFEMKSRTQ